MSALAGTWALTKLAFRRDRIMLAVWIYGLTAFVASTVYGFKKLYPNESGLAGFAATASRNAAFLSLYGPLYGHSLGSLTAWRDGAIIGLLIGLMSIFIVIRHTRADEESGRLELIAAAAVGRHAPLASALVVAWVANLVLLVTMAGVAIALGLTVAGSIALAAGIIGSGLVFAGIAALAAQAAQNARLARGLAIGAIAVAYLLRAIGDSAGAGGPRWLSWLSPIGWGQLDRAFGSIRWWVLILPLVTAVVVTAGAAVLAARRDYDAGLLAQRQGSARAAAALRSPLALAWRLQRGTMFAWLGGAIVYGLIIGSSAKGVGGVFDSSELRRIIARLGGTAALSSAYLAALLGFTGLVSAAYAITTVLRLRTEETSGYADAVLATRASRLGWAGSHIAIAALGTTAIMVVVGLGMGLGYAHSAGDGSGEIARLTLAGLAQAPAALVLGGLAAALFGLVPDSSVAASWSVFGLVVAVLLLGETLGLSHWALDVSPFTHVPKLPGGVASPTPFVLLTVIAVVFAVVGLAGLRRRDIG